MQRAKPPFRADHVGSLLRSSALKDARAKREKNEITAEQLKTIEDREIETIIKKQEAVGLKSITDGEYRRAFWNYDFLGKLDGVEAYLCDPALRQQVTERGDDPNKLPHDYARMINAAISDVPADMTTAMHLCRGNFQSTFVASGGYEPVAEILFNEINIQAYFMEYDSDRAGGFEPLRFVPKDKTVVLGLVTSKSGTLESKDELKRRIDQASKYISLDQLCLSPQCGFASTEEGNILAEDEQWAKLKMVVELADEVWGR